MGALRGRCRFDAVEVSCRWYYLHHGFGTPTDAKIEGIAKRSIEELRTELDRKIEAFPPKRQ